MDQELANLHQERDELERSNQTLMNEFTMMNHKYVRKSCVALLFCLAGREGNNQFCNVMPSFKMFNVFPLSLSY